MKEYQLASIGELTVGARGRKKNASEFSLKGGRKDCGAARACFGTDAIAFSF